MSAGGRVGGRAGVHARRAYVHVLPHVYVLAHESAHHTRMHACTHARMHACTHARMHTYTHTGRPFHRPRALLNAIKRIKHSLEQGHGSGEGESARRSMARVHPPPSLPSPCPLRRQWHT